MSDDSGDEREGVPINRHVGKTGRLTLKWAWIQAARSAVRKGGRMRAIFDRYTNNGKHNRNRGYIVVAHQLCLIGYVLWKKDVDYSEVPPPRPGSKPASPPQSQACESSTPAEKSEGVLCGKIKKEKTSRAEKGRKNRDMSRPGTDQPHSALAAEHP
jgi:hypothetical protein